MNCRKGIIGGLAGVFAVFLAAAPAQALAQGTDGTQSETKGQDQKSGGLVKFGTTYSLSKCGLNFTILKAYYSIDPFPSYEKTPATADRKLLVLDIAIKNATPNDNDNFPQIAVFDEDGNKYETGGSMISLQSKGVEQYYRSLKPGQGVGQPSLHDPLRMAFSIPLEAKITKIIVDDSRLNKKEEVVRYLMAGSDKDADPANVIGQLPPNMADGIAPGNKGLRAGRAKIGESFVSYYNTYRVNSVKTSSDPIEDGVAPEEGKQFVIVSVTVKNNFLASASYFDSLNLEGAIIKDSEGDKTTAMALYKGTANEKFENNGSLEPGDERTVRYVFQISAKTKPKTLIFSASAPYFPWQIDLQNQ